MVYGVTTASSPRSQRLASGRRCGRGPSHQPAVRPRPWRGSWWAEKDSNLRRRCHQIYSLAQLTALVSAHADAKARRHYGTPAGPASRGLPALRRRRLAVISFAVVGVRVTGPPPSGLDCERHHEERQDGAPSEADGRPGGPCPWWKCREVAAGEQEHRAEKRGHPAEPGGQARAAADAEVDDHKAGEASEHQEQSCQEGRCDTEDRESVGLGHWAQPHRWSGKPAAGIEPATVGLQNRCSATELRRRGERGYALRLRVQPERCPHRARWAAIAALTSSRWAPP